MTDQFGSISVPFRVLFGLLSGGELCSAPEGLEGSGVGLPLLLVKAAERSAMVKRFLRANLPDLCS